MDLFGVFNPGKLSEGRLVHCQNQNVRKYMILTCGLIFRKMASTEGLVCDFSGGRDFLSSLGDPAWSS